MRISRTDCSAILICAKMILGKMKKYTQREIDRISYNKEQRTKKLFAAWEKGYKFGIKIKYNQ